MITIGTFLYPKYIRLKAKLTHEFELTFKGASLAFNESIIRHVDYLDYNLDDAFSRLEGSLISQAKDLDGYLSRMFEGDSGVMIKISNIFEESYKEYIYPSIVDFEESYKEELAKLEDGLLIGLNDSLYFGSSQNQFNELEQSILRIKNILRSPKGLIIKVVDDSFEWVPIAGDVWGFLKIIYDPRKENIENKIVEVTEALRLSLKQWSSKYSTLKASHVEMICRASFDGNYAVLKYLYLTYFRR